MVLNQEGVTYKRNNVPMKLTPVNKQSAWKSLCLFINILDVKSRTEKRRVGDAKSKHKAMKVGNILWTKKKDEKCIQK